MKSSILFIVLLLRGVPCRGTSLAKAEDVNTNSSTRNKATILVERKYDVFFMSLLLFILPGGRMVHRVHRLLLMPVLRGTKLYAVRPVLPEG